MDRISPIEVTSNGVSKQYEVKEPTTPVERPKKSKKSTNSNGVKKSKPKRHLNMNLIWGLIGILVVIGLLFGIKFYRSYVRKQSYDKLYEELAVEVNPDFYPVFEAGDKLTFGNASTPELLKVPDQLRSAILSVPKDIDLSVGAMDLNEVGEKTVDLVLSTTDGYGQLVTRTQQIPYLVQDTHEVDVAFLASSIRARTESDVYANVRDVIDPVFGPYPYSRDLENRTYRIDFNDLSFDKSGTYTVTVEINDNGKIQTNDFDVIVN